MIEERHFSAPARADNLSRLISCVGFDSQKLMSVNDDGDVSSDIKKLYTIVGRIKYFLYHTNQLTGDATHRYNRQILIQSNSRCDAEFRRRGQPGLQHS